MAGSEESNLPQQLPGGSRQFFTLDRLAECAVRQARLTKRVTSHIFRHSFASHLLQADYDIQTIQELPGHSSVKTTMIYIHTVRSQTRKESKSPLDFEG